MVVIQRMGKYQSRFPFYRNYKHIDAVLSVGQIERRKVLHGPEAKSLGSSSQENEPRAESTMGKESVTERPSGRSES